MVLNNPLFLIDPDGMEERINVFYTATGNFRNFVTNAAGKVTRAPGPNWNNLKSAASKSGFNVSIHSGESFTASDIASSTKNALVTLIIGHGAQDRALSGEAGAKKWVSTHLVIKNEAITPSGVVNLTDGSTSAPLPEVSGTLCLLTCNSSDRLGNSFSMLSGSTLVTNDGGRDGLTSIGTLEQAAFAMISVIVSGGSMEEAVRAGQAVIDGSNIPHDQGDRLKKSKQGAH